MASMDDKLGAERRFAFACSAMDEHKFSVVTMEGYEALSRPFRFTLTLVTDDRNVDFDTMLLAPCSLTILAPDGVAQTPYHGILAEFEQLHEAGGYVFYRATLVPRLWRLSLSRSSEVYLHEQTIPEIIETVLRAGMLSSTDVERRLNGAYRQRSSVCQYQETDLDFISRWMEKEGIAYYFEHEAGIDKLVLVDDIIGFPAARQPVTYRPADQLDTGLSGDAVQSFICRQKPLPRTVRLQDFNHRTAGVTLAAEATVAPNGHGEVMLYGENFHDAVEGRRYATLRAQEILCQGKVYVGEATAVGLRSGHFITLSRHYRDDFNGQYLVTEVHHAGSQAGALLAGIAHPFGQGSADISYHASFAAQGAAVQFRPARITPKPRIAGTMTAFIDAEAQVSTGQRDYADLDEFGQYKVQLPFGRSPKDRNQGSARMRMATPYTGASSGMHFPLLQQTEVLLSFTDGDPDQPVIMASVPNSSNPSVIINTDPAVNLFQTAGGNRISLDDTAGKERIVLLSPQSESSVRLGAASPNPPGVVQARFLDIDVPDEKDGILIRTTEDVLMQSNSLTLTAVPDKNVKHKFLYNLTAVAPPGAAPLPSWDMDTLRSMGTTMDENVDAWAAGSGVKELSHLTKSSFNHADSNSCTVGNSSSVTHGNNYSVKRGNSESETHGNSTSLTRGNSHGTTFGNAISQNYGTSTSTYFGVKTSISVAPESSLSIGVKMSLSASLAVNLNFAYTANANYGGTYTIHSAPSLNVKAADIKAAGTVIKEAVAELRTARAVIGEQDVVIMASQTQIINALLLMHG